MFLLVRCSFFQDRLENEDLAIANNDIKTQNLHRNEARRTNKNTIETRRITKSLKLPKKK